VRRFAIQGSPLQQSARYRLVIEALAHFAAEDFGQDQIFGYIAVFAFHAEAGAVNDPLMDDIPLVVMAGLCGLEATRPMRADELPDLSNCGLNIAGTSGAASINPGLEASRHGFGCLT